MRRLATISAILSVAAALLAVLLWRDAQRRRRAYQGQPTDTEAQQPSPAWRAFETAEPQGTLNNGSIASQPPEPAAPLDTSPLHVDQPSGTADERLGDLDGEDITITQRVRSKLGHEPLLAGLPHFNINTEQDGVVYLRGIVYSEEQRLIAEQIASQTEGVHQVVNELELAQDVNG